MTLPLAAIFDVDGTLCDVRSIRHFVEREGAGAKDFNAFHAASIDCPVNGDVKALLLLSREAGFRTVVVTGRPARWSFLTSVWLQENGIPYDELVLRVERDTRSDREVKRDIALQLTARYTVRFAVDDRSDILDIWNDAGIAAVPAGHAGAYGLKLREMGGPR